MQEARLTARIIPAGQWPDSRADQRAYWLSRPPSERVEAGREWHRRICAWFHLRGPSLADALRTARPRE